MRLSGTYVLNFVYVLVWFVAVLASMLILEAEFIQKLDTPLYMFSLRTLIAYVNKGTAADSLIYFLNYRRWLFPMNKYPPIQRPNYFFSRMTDRFPKDQLCLYESSMKGHSIAQQQRHQALGHNAVDCSPALPRASRLECY
jgi:hypothetical protein